MIPRGNIPLVGRTFCREVTITDEMIEGFAQFSGDHNPIHQSDQAAQKLGFQRRVAHGVIQAGLISAIVGMDLPGPGSVIHSMEMKWLKPCYPGDRIAVTLEVIEVHSSVETAICRVKISDRKGGLISRGSVQVGIGGLHD